MASLAPKQDDTRKRPSVLHLALIYAAFASLWILVSDAILAWLVNDSAEVAYFSAVKGLMFVVVTTLLLYGLLRRAATQARMAAERENLLQAEKLRALYLLESIAQSSTDAIFAKDAQGRYILFNKASELNVGKNAADVLGKTDREIFPAEDATRIMTSDQRVMAEKEAVTLERTLSMAGGARDFLTTQGPLFDEAGQVSGIFGIGRDITERKKTEEALRKSEETYRSLFDNMLNGLTHIRMIYEDGKPVDYEYIAINPSYLSITGITAPLIGRRISEVIPGYCENNPESLEVFGRVASTGIAERWEHHLKELGRWFSFSIYSPARGEAIIVFENITERKKTEEELRKLSLAMEQSPENIMITDLDARIEYVNESFVTNTGYSRQEVLGKNPRMLQSGKTPRENYHALWTALTSGESWQGELYNRRKDGSEYIEHAILSPVRQPDGRITHYMAIKQDITKIKLAEAEIKRLAFHDPLTGLPNRALLLEHAKQALAVRRREKNLGVLLLLNINRFKNINDAGGSVLGDKILKAVGERLNELLREGDMVARMAGDEFAILLPVISEQQHAAARHAIYVAEKVQANLRSPFHIDEHSLVLTASFGIALFPQSDRDTAEDVLRYGDTALHHAKEKGSSQITFFDGSLEQVAKQRFGIEQELHQAISNGDLRLYLQTQVDAGRRLTGAEALVRWQHPGHGLLPPATFIQVAEESDLIVKIGEWVFAEVCRLLTREKVACHPLRIAVNISPRHFRQPDFVPWIKRILGSSGADPSRLTLEITESLIVDNLNDVSAKMGQLAELGIHFSMDDFGTGYSSLAYLKRLPIHELKIDKTFVQDAPTDPNDAALVETILAVARHMHLRVVAEGVETEEQAEFLKARADVIHQGYLFGRPEPAEDWLEKLEQDSPPA